MSRKSISEMFLLDIPYKLVTFKYVRLLFVTIISFMGVQQPSLADDIYWVNGTGKWSDYKNHWMEESGGSISQGRIPTISDNVIFDENSFSVDGQEIQIDILNADVRNIDFRDINRNVILRVIAGGRDLAVYGSFFCDEKVKSNLPSLILAAGVGNVTLHTDGVHVANEIISISTRPTTIYTSNKSLCRRFVKSGKGLLNLEDSLIVSESITITNGGLNTKGNFIKSSKIDLNGGNTSVDLNGSLIEANYWTLRAVRSFDAGTSSIFISHPNSGFFNGGNADYYNVEVCGRVTVTGNNSFNTFQICGSSDIQLQEGSTQTVSDLAAIGTPATPIRISSDVFENEAFIWKNSGEINVTSVNIEDLHALGGATFNATNSVDLGNVQGWNITNPPRKTFYWVNGSGQWSDFSIHWATSSGGSVFHNALPTVFDEIIFDKNSFSGVSEVIIDLYHAYAGNMNWIENDDQVTFRPEYAAGTSDPIQSRLHVFGSLVFSELATSELPYIRFKHNTDKIIDSQGQQIAASIFLYHTGSYQILAHSKSLCTDMGLNRNGITIIEDSVLINQNLTMYDGTLVLDTSYVGVQNISLYSGIVDITKSVVQTSNWYIENNTSLSPDSSTIYVSNRDRGSFTGGDKDYFDVVLCGRIFVSGENKYNRLEICPGSDIYLPGNHSQIADSVIVAGEPGFPISISSNSEDVQAVITQNGGRVQGSYLYLSDSKADGAVFVADESIDLGNVSGWNITSPVPKDFYWVGGTGLWSEYQTHWATSSGGTAFHNRIPSALDNVYLDQQSFAENSSIIKVDQIKTYTKRLDFSQSDEFFNINGGVEFWIFASLLFSEYGSSGLNIVKFPVDTADYVIDSYGKKIANDIIFSHQGNYDLVTGNGRLSSAIISNRSGEVNLLGDLDLERNLLFNDGTFISNSYNMRIPNIDFGYSADQNPTALVFNIGSSHITSNSWIVGANVDFSSDSSEIDIYYPEGEANFFGGGKKYHKVNAACIVNIKDDNSYERLTITYGAKIFVEDTQSVDELIADGTSGNLIRISGGSFKASSGRIQNQYLILEDNTAIGPASFVAERSIDGGGNMGWNIIPPNQNIEANELNVLNGEPLCGEAIETTLSLPSGLLTEFRWFKDGALLPGDSSSIVVKEEGVYYAELTNACGTVANSNDIEIRREGPPVVPQMYQDGSTSLCINEPIDVNLSTDEQPRVHYNWLRNGIPIGYDEPTIALDTIGKFTLSLTKGECVVDSEDSIVIVINEDVPMVQSLQLLGNDTICLGDSSRLYVPYEKGTSYQWTNGDTTMITRASYLDAKAEGIYSMILKNGCGDIDAGGSADVTVKEMPVKQNIVNEGESIFCFYDSTYLYVPPEEEVEYTWYSNGGDLVKNYSHNKAVTDTSGEYYVSMQNRCGITVSDKIDISHIYLPGGRDILIDGDTIFCFGEAVDFSINTVSGESWVWYSDSDTLSTNVNTIKITTPGIYGVDIKNVCGLISANKRVPVNVLEIPAQPVTKDFYIQCGPGELDVVVGGGSDGNFVWYDENNQVIGGLSSDIIAVPLEMSKSYSVKLSNGYCEGPASDVIMTVFEVPVADAGEDREVIYGDEVVLGGNHDYPNTHYIWSPNAWINNQLSPTPTIWPEETTMYYLEAVGSNRCTAFDSVLVTVNYNLVIPNTFTPNNDGTNDVWKIRNIDFHPNSRLEIYSRWGTKLYETVGYQNDWSGVHNGKNLPVDTYFYVIQFNDEQKPKKGPLTIIR